MTAFAKFSLRILYFMSLTKKQTMDGKKKFV